MISFDPHFFVPAIAALVAEPRLNPPGPGQPNHAVKAQLDALGDDTNWLPQRVRDRSMALACRAGLYLYHNFLDEAHTLSQDLDTVEGSYWHALMHRREPDFSNAKYWFRRMGTHAIFEHLQSYAAECSKETPTSAAFLTRQAKWDPNTFVDLCEAALEGRSPCLELCQRIQMVEWELLFAYCYRHATGQV